MLQSSGDEQWIEKTSSKPSPVAEVISAKESASVVKVQAISNVDSLRSKLIRHQTAKSTF